jgi:hypothetical protein
VRRGEVGPEHRAHSVGKKGVKELIFVKEYNYEEFFTDFQKIKKE